MNNNFFYRLSGFCSALLPGSALIAFLLLVFFENGLAQDNLQVVTKKIEKTFNYREGYEVNIEGEKAEIDIRTWSKKEISVVIELTSKHPNKEIAERDMQALQYVAQRHKNKIYVRNFVSQGEQAPKPQSQFSASYIITIPEECPVYLKSHFGEAKVVNHDGSLRINGEFSKIGMENVRGIIEVQSRFGDILGKQLNGNITIHSRRSNVSLFDLGGHVNIDATYGAVKLLANSDLLDLSVRANYADVFFSHPDPQFFGYSLAAQHGKVNLPDKVKFNFIENLPDLKKVQFKPQREYYANVTISVNFGSIFIQKGK